MKTKRPSAILFTGYSHKIDYINIVKESGYLALLLTNRIKPHMKEVFDHVYEVDFYQKEAVDTIVPDLKKNYRIKAVISNYEKYVVPRSYLAEKLEIPCTSVYGACCSRNKLLQRYALSVMPENISWKKVKTLAGAQKALVSFGGEGFLKVISGIKSRCVYKIGSKENLKEVWSEFTHAVQNLEEDLHEDYKFLDFRFQYPNPRENFLMEQAISGQQITVSSFVSNHKIVHTPSICDVYTAKDIDKEDSFLAFRILPSKKEAFIVAEAKKVIETAIHILGFRYCGVFADLMVTPEYKIKIIEIASRIGGYRNEMYNHAYDISLSKILLQTTLGKKVTMNSKCQKYVSLIEIFPEKEGRFIGIDDPKNLLQSSDIIQKVYKVEKGDLIGQAKKGFPQVLWLLIGAPSYEEVYEKSLAFHQYCKVLVEPVNEA